MMKNVKELMVPLNTYTRVPEEASLLDAVQALETAQASPESDPLRPRDRAVLVQDRNERVIGKLSMWDLLRGLQPRYDHPIDPLSMVEDYGLWSHPLQNLAEKASLIKAKDVVQELTESERIAEDASLDEAVSRLIAGQHLSLIVTRDDEIVGILRLSDVFREVSKMMKASRSEPA